MTHVDTQSVLKLLAAEYERSKQEQIDRFLRDQEELNKKFSEYVLPTDDRDDTASDDSDTASVFTQRMSMYKSRPQTAVGWIDVDQANEKRSDGSDHSNADSETDEWKSAVASAGRALKSRQAPSVLKSSVPSQSNTLPRPPVEHKAGNVSSQSEGRLLNRRTERPRTATGVRRSRFSESQHDERGTEDATKSRTRPLRSSAPATISRNKPSTQNDKSQFLPDTRQQQNGLMHRGNIQPSYAAARSNQQSFSVLRNSDTVNKSRASYANQKPSSLDSKNCMIISSINPSSRDNKDGDFNSRMAKRRDTSRERRLSSVERGDNRKGKQLAVLKLPPLSMEAANTKPGQRRTPDYTHHGTNNTQGQVTHQTTESLAR